MNSVGKTSRPRRALSLGRLLVLILFAQVALVCLLGNWSSLEPPVPPTTTAPRLVWLGGSGEVVAALPGGAVLAEVSSAGFSGALWRGGDAVQLSAPLFPGSNERMGADATSAPLFAESVEMEPARLAAHPLPDIRPGVSWAAGSGTDAQPGASRLRLGGPLASLAVQVPGGLPVWTNADVLAPTTVQLLVEPGGGVLSAVVLPAGSGLAAADQEGLRLARQLQFPSGATDGTGDEDRQLVWGTVEFVWHTVEPPVRP
jgi:hypothetical protein